jgi:hypothetical protein
MINSLRIENFKSIKNAEIDCKKINVFIGEPNSGKSNILEALGLISFVEIFPIIGGMGNEVLKKFIRFKNIQDLFFNKDINNQISIITDNTKTYLEKVEIDTFALFQTNIPTGNTARMLTLTSNGAVTINTRPSLSKLNIKFYRFYPKEKFKEKRPGELLPPDGENLVESIRTNPEIMDLIGELLKDFGYELLLRETEGEIEIVRKFRTTLLSFPYSSISDTIQRLIFYLTAIKTNKNSVLVFEEPEAHSFPYYVSSLSEIIAKDINNNQYFISTHNPYFLISLLEKTAYDEINIFITKLEDYETRLYKVSEKGIEEMLSLEKDLFLNLDEFIG